MSVNYIEVRLASYSGYGPLKTQKDVKAAWSQGADFQILTYGPDCGRYINKADADKDKSLHVLVRYAKDTKVVGVK